MKILFLSVTLFISSYSFAQVGINTETPKATLDVAGSPTITTKLDGVIAPRITGEQLRAKTYTTAQTGAIVYVTAAATAPLDNQVIKVDAVGYYFFDGSIWNAMQIEPWNQAGTTAKATNNNQNIYQNGHIGIRETNPGSALSIVNDNQNDNYDDIVIETYSDGTQTPAFVYKSFAGSKAAPSNLSNDAFLGSMYFRGQVNNATPSLSAILSKYKGDGTDRLSNLEFYTSNLTDDADPKMILSEKGYLGVNELNPKSTLSVNGSLSTPFRTVTGSTTITDEDHTVALTVQGPATFTLPDPTTCKGRIYRFINYVGDTLGSGGNEINFNMGVYTFDYNTLGLKLETNMYLATNLFVSQGQGGHSSTLTIQSDGSNWYAVGL